MNIVLTGYRGSGKSTVGRRLAERLGMSFVDTDNLIEQREGRSIRQVVESRGWSHFRHIEKDIIREISRHENLVIASGGGAVLDPENVTALKENGLIIWLQAEEKALSERVNGDSRSPNQRPPLSGGKTPEEFEAMLLSRARIYRETSQIQIDTTDLDIETIVKRVVAALEPKI